MNSWKRTDDYQAVKALSEDVFVIDNATEYPDGQVEVYRVEVDVNDHLDTCKNIIDAYGYSSIENMKELYGDDWKQVLAECVAESLYSGSDSEIVFEGNKDSAYKYFDDLVQE